MRLLTPLLLLLAGLVSVPVAPATAELGVDRPLLRDAHGVHVEEVSRDGRLVRVLVATKALERPVRVNVLLPTAYDDSRQRWQVARTDQFHSFQSLVWRFIAVNYRAQFTKHVPHLNFSGIPVLNDYSPQDVAF